jgi:hypothetical protein
MFKFASLVAIASAASVEDTKAAAAKAEATAKAHMAAAQKKLNASAKIGSSKIGTLFTMPGVVTHAQLEANSLENGHTERCVQCSLAGGDWDWTVVTPAVAADEAKKIKAHSAVLSKTDMTCTGLDKKTAATAHAVVDPSVTYKDLFNDFSGCHVWGKVTKAEQLLTAEASTAKTHLNPVQSVKGFHTDFDTTKFDVVTSSWTVNWGAHAATDKWGAGRVILPYDFKGGMYMSINHPEHTNVAIRVSGTTDRYFDAASAKAMSVGKTNKVTLFTADDITFIMQPKSTWTKAINDAKATQFSIDFERASYVEMAKFTALHGGSTMWIIIGVIVVVLCCVTGCVWHYCKNKNKDDADGFYQVEDCYARI